MAWQGGRFHGCVCKSQKGYRVQIKTHGSNVTKRFSIRNCDGDWEKCRLAAESWHKDECIKNGWISSQWRVHLDLEGVVQFQLTNNDQYMIVDETTISLLDGKSFYAKTHGNMLHVVTWINGKDVYIHRLLCPQWSKVDHINRNGLDNRYSNLRNGQGLGYSYLKRPRVTTCEKCEGEWEPPRKKERLDVFYNEDVSWQGGRLPGSIYKMDYQYQKGYTFSIQWKRQRYSRRFLVQEFKEDWEKCRLAAESHRRQICKEKGWLINQWRLSVLPDTVEILLQNEDIMFLDKDDLSLLDKHQVYSHQQHLANTAYAFTSISTEENVKMTGIHQLLLPNVKKVDHINRNGLDNRRSNLRDGSGLTNARNCYTQRNNSSGRNGVTMNKFSWIVIHPLGQKRKHFAFSKFGCKCKAFEAACLFRDQIDEKFGITNGKNPIQT